MNQAASTLQRPDFPYQPFYCEENIWQLCQYERFKDSHVVFIASKGDAFPMLCQRAMPDPFSPVLWDYHVVLLMTSTEKEPQVIDFDTTLPFNSPLQTYFSHSFIDTHHLDPEYHPFYRIIPAADYVKLFRSDRSHMKTAMGWHAPPPDWPMMGGGGNNLAKFTDMNDLDFGEVLSGSALRERFG